MDINLTLIGQTIAMIVFVWFCMKFIWPPILNAIEERQDRRPYELHTEPDEHDHRDRLADER